MDDLLAATRFDRYINDQWTLQLEELGFDHAARELAEMALLCKPPFATCIAGRWGSGKTSLMRYAMTLLGGDMPTVRVPYPSEEIADTSFEGTEHVNQLHEQGKQILAKNSFIALSRIGESGGLAKPLSRVTTLWFSPWRFQTEPNPMVPLLHGLRSQLGAWARLSRSFGRAARIALEAGLEILGHLADMAAAIGDVRGTQFGKMSSAARRAVDKIDAQDFEQPTDAERFNLLFERAIQTILGVQENAQDQIGTNHRLVIFVDDLDRCEGEVSLRLLEAIKLYLSTRYCVFVLGLDVTAVESTIAAQWSGRPRGLAHEYLDKLFQTYLHMPVSDRYALFIHNRLAEWSLLPEQTQLPPNSSLARTHETARILAEVLPPNPRKVKNFLNSLHLAWLTAQAQADVKLDIGRDFLNFSMVQRLRARAPRTFTLLLQNPEAHLKKLSDFLKSLRANDPIQKGDDATVRAFFVHDFRHLVCLHDDWAKEPLNPALGLDDVGVNLESIAADNAFARHWLDLGISAADLRCYAGLSHFAADSTVAGLEGMNESESIVDAAKEDDEASSF